jgi:hypothetical protein
LAATIEIRVGAQINSAVKALQTLSNTLARAGDSSQLTAKKIESGLNDAIDTAKGFDRLKISNGIEDSEKLIASALSKIKVGFDSLENVFDNLQASINSIDLSSNFEQAQTRLNSSIEKMTADALGLSNVFDTFGTNVNLDSLVAAFKTSDKSVEALEAQIFALRDAIKLTTDPTIIERFSQQLNNLTNQLGQVKIKGAVKFDKIDASQFNSFNVPLIAPKIDLSQIRTISNAFDASLPSIDKLEAEILQVGNALDAATDPTMVNLLRANFEQLKASLATVQSSALKTAFIDAIKPAQLLENEITALRSAIKTSLNPDDVVKFSARLQVLQTQLANTKLGGIDLSKLSAPLSLLQSAFVDAVKPVQQLQNELEALEQAKLEATNPQSVKILSDQISKLQRQLVNTRTAGIEGTFNKLGTSAVDASGRLRQLPKATDAASFALLNLGRVAQDAPFGILGIANNLNPLLESFQRVQKEAGSTGKAFKAVIGSLAGGGGIGFALSIASSAAILFGDRIFGAGRKTEQAQEPLRDFAKIAKEVSSSLSQEAAKVTSLFAALSGANLNTSERKAALEELKSINKEYFGSLKEENGLIAGLTGAYAKYLNGLKEVGRTKALETQLNKLFDRKTEIELSLDTRFQSSIDKNVQKQISLLNAQLNAIGGKLTQDEIKNFNLGVTVGNENLQKRIRLMEQIRTLSTSGVRTFDGLGELQNELQSVNLQIDGIVKLLENTGKFDIKVPEVKVKKEKDKKDKSEFLLQFLPFDPSGKLDSEQRRQLLSAIAGFTKDFNNLLEGVNFAVQAGSDEDQIINLAKDYDKKLREGLVRFKPQPLEIDISFAPKDTSATTETLERLTSQFVDTAKKIAAGVNENLGGGFNLLEIEEADKAIQKLQTSVKKFSEDTGKQIGSSLGEPIEKAFGDIINGKLQEAINRGLSPEKIKEMGTLLAAGLGILSQALSGIQQGFVSFFETVIEGSGNAFQKLAQAVSQMLTKLVASLAAMAAISGILSLILPGASFSKIFSGLIGSSFGVKGFAAGGLVFGPTLGLVGEGSGTSRSNPEVIAPLDKLKNYISGASNGGLAYGQLVSVVRGKDIALVYERFNGYSKGNA